MGGGGKGRELRGGGVSWASVEGCTGWRGIVLGLAGIPSSGLRFLGSKFSESVSRFLATLCTCAAKLPSCVGACWGASAASCGGACWGAWAASCSGACSGAWAASSVGACPTGLCCCASCCLSTSISCSFARSISNSCCWLLERDAGGADFGVVLARAELAACLDASSFLACSFSC